MSVFAHNNAVRTVFIGNFVLCLCCRCLYAIFTGQNGYKVAEFAIQKISAEILFGQLEGCTPDKVKEVLRYVASISSIRHTPFHDISYIFFSLCSNHATDKRSSPWKKTTATRLIHCWRKKQNYNAKFRMA